MIIFEAPWDTRRTSLVLPNPDLGDTITPQGQLIYHETIDGTRYTYVKVPETEKLRLRFVISKITRAKVEELKNFYEVYAAEPMYLLWHDNRVFRVWWYGDSFRLQAAKYTGLTKDCDGNDILYRNELWTATFDLIGEQHG